MAYSYNLIEEKWIPCVTFDGSVHELGLRDALVQAHNYRELGGDSPLVTASLYRLLLAVLHRLFGPEDRDAWRALWAQGRWDAAKIDAYLDKWRHRFDLFDAERPFYQADDPRVKARWAGDMLHETRAGDAVFDHHSEKAGLTFSAPVAARNLVAMQTYGIAGKKGSTMQFTDAPATRAITFLAKGRNLFRDLLMNMTRYPPPDDAMPHSDLDAPCWEMDDPFLPARVVPFGLLDYLTWQNRRMRLEPTVLEGQQRVTRVSMGPGLRLSREVRNPHMGYRATRKAGWWAVLWEEDRALWRDSTVLTAGKLTQPPRQLDWLSTLIGTAEGLEPTRLLQVAAYGMSTKRGQDRVYFYRSEQLPLPMELLRDEDLVTHLEAALALAEAAASQLAASSSRSRGALVTLAAELLCKKVVGKLGSSELEQCKQLVQSWGAERRYWAALELPFYDLVTGLAEDAPAARAAWADTVRRAAWAALRAVTQSLQESASALKATVLAEEQLAGGLGKVWKEHMPELAAKEEIT